MIVLIPSDGFGFNIIAACKAYGMHDDGTWFFDRPVLKVALPGFAAGQQVYKIVVDFNSQRPGIHVYTDQSTSPFFPLNIEWT